LWLLTRVILLGVTVGAGTATAQTVIVRNARPASKIEVQVDEEAAKSTPADANGDATLALALAQGNDESVRFFVDVCDELVRVHLVRSGVQPAPSEAGCNRNEIWGLYLMRPVTTFVVDVEGTVASIHLTQGPAPVAWLGRGQLTEHTRKYFQATPPTGLVLFGGVGPATFSDAVNTTCGDAPTCTGSHIIGVAAAGATYWIGRFVGAQISLIKPAQVTATGSGNTYHFNSTVSSRLLTVAGAVGGPAGPVKLYALAGANYHQATFTTTETIADTTVVVNNVTQTIPGGTQTFEHKTQGWNWMVGGGLEAWATRPVAFYVEAQRARLKATDIGSGEGGIDDNLTFIVVGARVHIWR
jgi:hypothetical protein